MTVPSPVSVVLATYNGEKFVREQIDSIAAQTVRPTQLLIADDASTDRTLEVAAARAAEHGLPVEAWRNPHRLGFAENFMAAARRSSGQFVAFCDQDDVWLPHKLSKCLGGLEDRSVVLAVHDSAVVDEDLRSAGARCPGVDAARTTDQATSPLWPVVPGFTMVFRRDLVDVPGWTRRPDGPRHCGPMVHDEWVYFVASCVGRIAWIPDCLALHREHATNATSHVSEKASPHRRLMLVGAAGAAQYQRLSAIASQRAATDRALEPTTAGSAFRRAQVLDLAAKLYGLRGELYASTSRTSAVRLFVELARLGAYSHSGPAALGPKAGLKDLSRVGAPHTRWAGTTEASS